MSAVHSSLLHGGPASARRLLSFRFLSLLALLLISVSCIEVQQSLVLNADGAGVCRIALRLATASVPDALVVQAKKDAPEGWREVQDTTAEGVRTIVYETEFADVSKLSDEEAQYSFKTVAAFPKADHYFEIAFKKGSQAAFPITVTVRMPGKVVESNGKLTSESEVMWELTGYRAGWSLQVHSTTTALQQYWKFGAIVLGLIVVGKLFRGRQRTVVPPPPPMAAAAIMPQAPPPAPMQGVPPQVPIPPLPLVQQPPPAPAEQPGGTIVITRSELGRVDVTAGPLAGRSFEVTSQGITIGRAPGCEIQIQDGRVSSKHLWIGLRGGVVMAEDAGSTNGTFLGAISSGRIKSVALKDGDIIIVSAVDVCVMQYRAPVG